MIKPLLLTLSLFIASASATFAQTSAENKSTTEQSESVDEPRDLTPVLFGAVKVKYEQNTVYDALHRFNVRNSRIGVKGFASQDLRYAIQIDFNNEGTISILDSYVAYVVNPNLEISLGQQQYHFSRDLDRGPNSSMFSNRSFIAKYLTTYYGSRVSNGVVTPYVKSIGSRDLGVLASYKMSSFPFAISGGLFNGSGANNPEWTNTTNFITRMTLGREEGFSGSASYYYGTTPTTSHVVETLAGELINEPYKQKIVMYGGELRYADEHLLVEAEYATRRLNSNNVNTIEAAHIHGYYKFNMQPNNIVNHIAPLLRFDIGNGIEFINKQSALVDRYYAKRVTTAINFGLTEKLMRSELRIAFEKYLLGNSPSDISINPLLQDKYTIEIVASF